MAMVVKVRFRRASKLYDFEANGLEIGTGTYIVTETVRGVEIGECMSELREVSEKQIVVPLKPILRVATDEDLQIQRENEEKERQALATAEKKVLELKLDMKLVDVEYSFDRTKITFYFTADGRVDFRILVKSLANVFKTRIELRQIGVRDEAKMLGGLGPCGRPICCRQFLSDFQPVSIKMAKEQNLSLNPTKISGICDRLMCCLKYEQDQYESTRKKMPKIGREILTPDGIGVITAINVLSETVTVRLSVGDSFENRTYRIDDCQRTDGGAQKISTAPATQKAEPETVEDVQMPDEIDDIFPIEQPDQEPETDEEPADEVPKEEGAVKSKRKKRRNRRGPRPKPAEDGTPVESVPEHTESGTRHEGQEEKTKKPRNRNRRRGGSRKKPDKQPQADG